MSMTNDGLVSPAERRKVVPSKPPTGLSGDALAEDEYAIVLLSRDILWCRCCRQGR
jgi:hypothetical protein